MTIANNPTPNDKPLLEYPAPKDKQLGQPKVPAAVCPGGNLELRLNNLAGPVSAQPNGEAVYNSVSSGLWRIRKDFDRDQQLSFPLGSVPSEGSRDVVLDYCVAFSEGMVEEADTLRPKALETYLMGSEAYDMLLKDLLPKAFLTEANGKLIFLGYDAGTNQTALDDWNTYCSYLPRRRRQALLGLSTGIPSLDRAIGGIRGLTFLGGTPGVGKTTLAIACSLAALRQHDDLGVIIYSLEMSRTVIYDRIACHESGVDFDSYLGSGNEPTAMLLKEAEVRLRRDILPRLRIVEKVRWEPKKLSAQNAMREVENEFIDAAEVKRILTVIDYFQLLPVEEKIGSPVDNDYLRIRLLQDLQEGTRTGKNPTGDPFLVISEVRKGESGRTELGMADLMGSSRLAYCAESILLMEPGTGPDTVEEVPVLLKVAKGRDGTVRTEIPLIFEHTRSRFREAPKSKGERRGGKAAKGTTAKKADGVGIDPFAGKE